MVKRRLLKKKLKKGENRTFSYRVYHTDPLDPEEETLLWKLIRLNYVHHSHKLSIEIGDLSKFKNTGKIITEENQKSGTGISREQYEKIGLRSCKNKFSPRIARKFCPS